MEKILHLISVILLSVAIGFAIKEQGFAVWQILSLPIFIFGLYKIIKKEKKVS
ncbi:MAG: hypothetical protein ACXIT9_10905 [Nitritalea sp.]